MAVYRICERHEYFVEAENAEEAQKKAENIGARLVFSSPEDLAVGYESNWVEFVGEPERYKNGSIADYDDDRLENGESNV
jgi:hypothetical protein